jgi:hypothetical protein
MLVSQLLRIADLTLPRPLTLESCCRAALGQDPVLTAACTHGESLAQCTAELIETIRNRGLVTRDGLEDLEQRETLEMDWSDKAFTAEDISALPGTPGVYGFTDKQGQYIYIGKAKSLKRRLMGYFRNTEESPEKLTALRRDAHDLTVHKCGSELESLILEYRLIRKHNPLLNTKVEVNERKGSFRPIDDCIVLMPHAEGGRIMSFWFRREQKIVLKPLTIDHMPAQRPLSDEIRSFFFSDKLEPSPTDFPEQEIVFRWLKRHYDALPVVPVHRLGSAEETAENLRCLAEERFPVSNPSSPS